jgi:hypothetical protein
MATVDPHPPGELDLQEQIARINNLLVSTQNLAFGSDNLLIDTQKKQREFHLSVWQIVLSAMAAGAALLGAVAAIFGVGVAAGARFFGH